MPGGESEAEQAASVIHWLRDCLAEERSGRGITHAFAKTVKARHFLEGEDRTTGLPTWMADLPPSKAAELVDRAALYRRERGFHFGTLFLAGTVDGRSLGKRGLSRRVISKTVLPS